MRRLGIYAGLMCLLLVTGAHADTVYLKNGDTVWGSEVTESGQAIVVFRAGEKLEFPRADVLRIERARLSIPRYYSAPDGGGFTTISAPPGIPGMAGPGPMPGAPGMPPAPSMPPGMGAPQPGAAVPPGTSSGPAVTGGSSASGAPGLSMGSSAGATGPSQPTPSGSGGPSGSSASTAPVMGPLPPGPGQPPIGLGSPRDRDVPSPPIAR
jgi:hypothetical protein